MKEKIRALIDSIQDENKLIIIYEFIKGLTGK